ncbi:hypothetical protein JA1_003834 [Spathaspora sp. JA1]|nr:hypothetical protein JA1_003834 [Spathaspora sp. JA1]
MLMFHSMLSLLGVVESYQNNNPRLSVLPFKGILLFVFSLIEILVMGVFWIETLNQAGFNKAILFTICYLLKWEDSRTNQIVQNTTTYIRQLQENKKSTNPDLKLEPPDSTKISYSQEFKRLTSFGFDTFSIISDIH